MWDTGHGVAEGTLELARNWLKVASGKRKGKAIREEFEREWQFNARLRAEIVTDKRGERVILHIGNPFDEPFEGRMRVAAAEGGWHATPGTRKLMIAPGETTSAILRIERTDDDWDRLPRVTLAGTRDRDLTRLVRGAFEARRAE